MAITGVAMLIAVGAGAAIALVSVLTHTASLPAPSGTWSTAERLAVVQTVDTTSPADVLAPLTIDVPGDAVPDSSARA